MGANHEREERVKCVSWNAQHRERTLPKSTPFVLNTILKDYMATCGPTGVRPPPLSPQYIQSHETSPTSLRARDEARIMSLALGTDPEVKERVGGKANRVQSSRIVSSLVCVHRKAQHLELKLLESTRFVLITVLMVAVATCGPTCCTVSPPLISSQNVQSHEKSPKSHRARG